MKKMSYQTVTIEKVERSCGLCEKYAEKHMTKQPKVAVLSCEGACSRGEIARRAANLVAHRLAPEQTVRICLGGAFTKESGQRELVRRAGQTLAIEGCHLDCASRMMQGVLPALDARIIRADSLYQRSLPFGIEEVPEELLAKLAEIAARQIVVQYLDDRTEE